MEMEHLSQALVATLRSLTVGRKLSWRLVQHTIRPAPGAVASPTQFEAFYKDARFLLYEEEQHRYHPGMEADVWLKRHVLAIHDELGREIWHAADAALSVSHLHREVGQQVIRIDEVLKTLIDPETYLRYSRARTAPFSDIDARTSGSNGIRDRLRRLRLAFIERFYWKDVLAARERMVRRQPAGGVPQ